MRITHQSQPTSTSCVATCVAMLSGLSAASVHGMFTEGYLAGTCSVSYMLANVGIQCEVLTCDRVSTLNVGEVYLAIVPSVNMPGFNHMVIIDCHTNDGFMMVWDPAKGTGKRYYVPRGDDLLDVDELATALVSYTVTHRILLPEG